MSQHSPVLYTAKTTTTGGRSGQSRSDDNRLDVKLSLPGAPGNGTNPEQLFAAGWSACFIGAMQHVAQAMGVRFPTDATVHAEVDLANTEERGYFLQARLNVSLPGLDRTLAQQIVELAHQNCPYSKVTRGNIDAVIRLL